MSDPHHPAPKSGGGLGKALGGVILLFIVIFSEIIAAFADQIGYLFQMMKMNAGPILGILGTVFVLSSIKKK